MPPYIAVEILIVYAALLMFYLYAACQARLRQEFDHEFFHPVVNAYRLDDYPRFRKQLKLDFPFLTYLLRNIGNAKAWLSKEESLWTLARKVSICPHCGRALGKW